MLTRILAFLLETGFFLLIASALLRAWMNWLRINMSAPPGSLVMALTSWLVKPLRRVLPQSLVQSRLDWASLLAAGLMALGYALLGWLLFGLWLGQMGLGFGPLILLSLLGLGLALKMLLKVALQTLFILVLGYALLSWVQPGSPAYALLGRLTEPVLAPLRRLIPAVGGVDLSALALMLVLQIALMVLG